ncbi:response regulator transcription factor [Limisalsivibrio acetivorans]|uniref:response regulator transcription factor n=1 Tax=Limisalsivibrio acetivorans TaxID=1304888 RepID=UPI0003B71DB1|nr:response regulator [Limisalsivibrio acetivorans]
MALNVSEAMKSAFKQLSVLFVEDDKNARESMSVILGQIFGRVELAADGCEGLEIYKNRESDIILTDLWMPLKSGIDMIREIRDLNLDSVVVVMSAYDIPNYDKQVEGLNIECFLKKPFCLEDLEDCLVHVATKAAKTKGLV